jgi:hypothetical protein
MENGMLACRHRLLHPYPAEASIKYKKPYEWSARDEHACHPKNKKDSPQKTPKRTGSSQLEQPGKEDYYVGLEVSQKAVSPTSTKSTSVITSSEQPPAATSSLVKRRGVSLNSSAHSKSDLPSLVSFDGEVHEEEEEDDYQLNSK